MTEPSKILNVAILIFDGVEELDFVGPWEVFTMAKAAGAALNPFTVGWEDKQITCAKGLKVTADYAFADAPNADIVLVPGGQGTRSLVKNDAFIEALQRYLAQATWQTSVCTGAALLGKAGFLDGRNATTNRSAFELFRAWAPNAKLIEDRRYVRDGNVVTSAGVSAGIDMSLWLVGQLFGEALALATQSHMEYFPEPPYGTPAR